MVGVDPDHLPPGILEQLVAPRVEAPLARRPQVQHALVLVERAPELVLEVGLVRLSARDRHRIVHERLGEPRGDEHQAQQGLRAGIHALPHALDRPREPARTGAAPVPAHREPQLGDGAAGVAARALTGHRHARDEEVAHRDQVLAGEHRRELAPHVRRRDDGDSAQHLEPKRAVPLVPDEVGAAVRPRADARHVQGEHLRERLGKGRAEQQRGGAVADAVVGPHERAERAAGAVDRREIEAGAADAPERMLHVGAPHEALPAHAVGGAVPRAHRLVAKEGVEGGPTRHPPRVPGARNPRPNLSTARVAPPPSGLNLRVSARKRRRKRR
jgi:hypothetical protein